MAAFDDLNELKRQLDEHAEDIARHLYGNPTMQRRHEYRWGRRGSVQLIRRKGVWRWHHYESGDGGSILDAISDARGLDFAGAVRWARAWLRVDGVTTRLRPNRTAPPIDVDEEADPIWASLRSRAASCDWAALRVRLLSNEPPRPVVTTEDEDAVLARGRQVRRLRWVSV